MSAPLPASGNTSRSHTPQIAILFNALLSKNPHVRRSDSPRGRQEASFPFARLHHCLSGRAYLDGKEVDSVSSGAVYSYIRVAKGSHRITVQSTNTDGLTCGPTKRVNGEAMSARAGQRRARNSNRPWWNAAISRATRSELPSHKPPWDQGEETASATGWHNLLSLRRSPISSPLPRAGCRGALL